MLQKSDSTVSRSRTTREGFIENYTALKSSKNIKNGFAEVLFNNPICKKQIALGQYKYDARIGEWRFYFLNGEVEQIYNYTIKRVEFETKNNLTSYKIDNAKEGDEIIKSVKIGCSYNPISVMGKISNHVIDLKYKKALILYNYIYYLDDLGTVKQVEVEVKAANYSKTQNVDLKLLRDEELKFTPTHVNKTPVNSSFTISSKLIIN